jgi:hypothetical protein
MITQKYVSYFRERNPSIFTVELHETSYFLRITMIRTRIMGGMFMFALTANKMI